MMRSPRSFAVVCRTSAGELVVKEQPWRSLWERLRFLRWPFVRGGVVLVESLVNGMSALSFSARVQMASEAQEEVEASPEGTRPPLDLGETGEQTTSFAPVIALSVLFAVALFVALPHLLTALAGFSPASLGFHLVDGLIKAVIFVAYIAGIGLLPDIRRVFMYHGAEHKAIYAYEQGLEMTVESARRQSRFHPRCGTSFLFIVILISIVLFAVTLRVPIFQSSILDHLIKVLIKIPLLFPVAGLSYELLKLSSRFQGNPLVRALSIPGLLLQRITTREPTEDQLEVALVAIQKTLWREETEPDSRAPSPEIEVFPSFDAARAGIG